MEKLASRVRELIMGEIKKARRYLGDLLQHAKAAAKKKKDTAWRRGRIIRTGIEGRVPMDQSAIIETLMKIGESVLQVTDTVVVGMINGMLDFMEEVRRCSA